MFSLAARNLAAVTPPQPDYSKVARSAVIRAESIRQQLARSDSDNTLDPLRQAWSRRAAELELVATALWPQADARAFLARTA